MTSFKTKLCSVVLAAVTAAGLFMGASADVKADEIPAAVEAPAEAVPMVNSVYTNEPVTLQQAGLRPIAAMIPTDKKAQPSYGIGNADILYEIMEEGGISRQMAIIPNWQCLPQIGNLRSCRLYYIPAAKEWDPILIHFGGVFYMQGTIDAPDVNNLSGTSEYGVGGGKPGSGYFFRTTNLKAPHNAYITAEGIQKACAELGYQTTIREEYYNSKHFNFAEGVNTLEQYGGQAQAANVIDLADVYSYTKSSLQYDPVSGLYLKNLHGKPQIDALTGVQLGFANVIVQNTSWAYADAKGYLAFQMIDNTQDGYYFTKGKAIHIRWEKTSDYEPTRYYDDNGNEIQLNTGKTYIAVAQAGKAVKFY